MLAFFVLFLSGFSALFVPHRILYIILFFFVHLIQTLNGKLE